MKEVSFTGEASTRLCTAPVSPELRTTIDEVIEHKIKTKTWVLDNVTLVDVEPNEALDALFDLVPFELHLSGYVYYILLEGYGVLPVLGSAQIIETLFKRLHAITSYINSHTDKPQSTRAFILGVIRGLDDEQARGLVDQILLLQGVRELLAHYDSVGNTHLDNGLESLDSWLGSLLSQKLSIFSTIRFSLEEGAAVRPLIDYLCKIDVDGLVWQVVYGKVEPTDVLPEELNTEAALSLFDRAAELGYCERDGELYRWLGSSSLFGYFVDVASTALGIRSSNGRIPWRYFVVAFQADKRTLETARRAVDNYNNKELSKPEGYEAIWEACRPLM